VCSCSRSSYDLLSPTHHTIPLCSAYKNTLALVTLAIALVSGVTFTVLPALLPHIAPNLHASFLRDSIPSLDARINATLCPLAPVTSSAGPCVYHIIPPDLPRVRYVRRDDITSAIIRVIAGDTFAVIEGPNRVGKSAAVKIAVSALSHTRSVRKVDCLESHGVADVLAALLLADLHDVRWRVNLPAPHRPLLELPTYKDFHVAMLRRPRQNPEPVFVVETAERLAIPVLLTLLSFGALCASFLQWCHRSYDCAVVQYSS
jgi:hypothetical protein